MRWGWMRDEGWENETKTETEEEKKERG